MKFFLFLFSPLLLIENAWARTMLGQGMNSKHCFSPTIENGWVEAENNVQGNSFVGRFRCSSGFILTGEKTIKCRDGVWTIKPRDFPYCAAIGSCDVTQLPQIQNGNLKADKRYMASVYKYKCNKGYQMIGPSKVYCTRQGWSAKEAPSCAKSGCDSEELLGGGLKHGRSRQMFGGKVFRFRCNEGSFMSGSPQVFCDGKSWNGSMPHCYVPPRSPRLTVFLDGAIVGRNLAAAAGQKVTISCQNTGGHPTPTLSIVVGDQRLEQANHTFTMEEEHSNIHLSCAAENILSTSPVSSQYQVLRLKYAPKKTYLKGDEEVKTAETAEYFCSSDESNPAPDVSVVARDQNGEELSIIKAEAQPKMKGRKGFAGSLGFRVKVETGVTRVDVECKAANEVGEAVSLMTTTIKYPPATVALSGPKMVKLDEDSVFTCTTSASNPEPVIEWEILTFGQEDSKVEKETEGETENLENGGFRRKSTFVLPASREQSVEVNCVVTVQELKYKKASEILEVTRMSPPKRIFIEGPDTIERKGVSQFSCFVEGGIPHPQLSMRVLSDDDLISTNDQDKITVDLTNTSDITSLTVNCEASNQAGTLQNSQTVPVHWAPTHVFVTGPESVKEGDDAVFVCDADVSSPLPEIEWEVTNLDGEHVEYIDTKALKIGQSQLTIQSVERKNQNLKVLCTVTNSLGSLEHSVTSQILWAPSKVSITGPSTLKEGAMGKYSCLATSSNPVADIKWEVTNKDGESFESFETEELISGQTITSFLQIMDVDRKDKQLTVMCRGTNSVGMVDYAVTAEVSWAPASVSVTGSLMLEDGDMAEYFCSAAPSNPPANIVWTITDKDGKPVLFSEETNHNSSSVRISGVERRQGTLTILCRGTNTVGSVEDSLTSVISGPTKLLITGPDMLDPEFDFGEDVHYYCSADGSLSDYLSWTLNGEILVHQAETKEASPEEGNIQTHSVFSVPPAFLLPGSFFTVGCQYKKLMAVKSVQIKERELTTTEANIEQELTTTQTNLEQGFLKLEPALYEEHYTLEGDDWMIEAELEQETNGFIKLEPAKYEEESSSEAVQWISHTTSSPDNQKELISTKSGYSTVEEVNDHNTKGSQDAAESERSVDAVDEPIRSESKESNVVLKSSEPLGLSAKLSSKDFLHSFSASTRTAPYKLLTVVFVTFLAKLV